MPLAPRFRALSAALLAFGLVAGALTTATLHAPAARADAPTDTADVPGEAESDAAPPTLLVAPTDAVIRPGTTEVEFTLLLRNPGTEPLPGGRVELRFGITPVPDRGGITAELAAGSPRIAEAEFGTTDAGEEQTTTISVPRDRIPLAADAPFGAHLVEASFTPKADTEGNEADPLRASAPLVWRGSGTTPATVPLGMIVPLVFPSDVHTLPTRQQLSELTPGWDQLLTEARAHHATLAIDPRIIAGIRAYGTEAPTHAQDFLARMSALNLPSFLLQFADADPAAQAALGFTQLLAPTSLDFVSRFGKFPAGTDPDAAGSVPSDSADPEEAVPEPAAPATETPTAGSPSTPSPDPATPTLPTLRELMQWADAQPVAWPAEGAVDQATLDLLEASGIRTVVLDSGNVTGATAPRATLGTGGALVTDAALGAAAQAALGADTAAERALGAAHLSAELAVAAQDGSPGLLLGLDRGAVASAAEPGSVLQLIESLDWAQPTPIAALPEGRAMLRAGDTLEDRRELLRSSAGRESSVNALGAVLVHPEYLSGYQRTRLLELFATRFASPGVDFTEIAAAYRERDAELLTGVRAISTEHTQLVGTSTRVPVQLQNALPFDARVQVRVEPSSAGLSISERTYENIAVPAEANQRVLVPVHSRVSSGESGIIVSVAAASGEPTVFTGTLPISIRSSVEAIGLWVLGGLAALLLGFGIWRSLRRKRRGDDTVPDPDAEALRLQDPAETLSTRSPAQE
ncbi:hypothetical protein FM113_12805 [Leucobacter sp. 7(1)]|uniref:DUF6049 family protein n=1 Tax=Leucobacter sp. 7(1) TaxID=1255613 RepID=UPI00097EB4ED|nr:DUF6049 family protein [Leucobacter sp. 7(1)]SJN11702.1 hypothetical protein FM113_12805 [Leucobacter sp. 7(1)]